MSSKRTSRMVCVALFGAALSTSAHAEIRDFILEWSGESFQNGATATGHISIDDAVLLNPGHNNFFTNPGWVTAFDITVEGSLAGDGTWTLADYEDIVLDTDYGPLPRGGLEGEPVTALDFTKELVGQPTSNGQWGTPDGNNGDFNIFTAGGPIRGLNPIPYGTFYFTITIGDFGGGDIDRGGSEQLLLTSFRPVPTPSTLMLGALPAAFLARRRRA